jgi:hypothetical protein
MNARREELIALAAETLGCVGQTAHGHWIYRCAKSGLWMVSNDAMHRLGVMLARPEYHQPPHASPYDAWCATTNAMEIDVDAIVRDHEITAETNLDELMAWESTGHLAVHLLLRFYRDDVVDTVRINEEIDRDREPDCEAAR